MTENYRANNQKRSVVKKPIQEVIETIKDSYNARHTLIKLGYAAKGGNYSRIYSIMRMYGINFREKTEEEIAEGKERARLAIQDYANERRKVAQKEGRTISKKTPPRMTRKEAHIANRKVPRPTREELLCMVWDRSIIKIAKEMGICDNTIRKWAKQYNIPVPPVGYWAKWHNNHKEICEQIKGELFIQFNLVETKGFEPSLSTV